MLKKEFTITAYTENQVGLLIRISLIFSRRKINIASLNTSPTEVDSVHRFTIVIYEAEDVVRKVCTQIEKQIDVLKVFYNDENEIVWKELALYKVSTDAITKDLGTLLRKFGARIVDFKKDYSILELAGDRFETDNLLKALESYELSEFVRSARIAIVKSSNKFHEQLMLQEKQYPGQSPRENEFLSMKDENY